MCTAALPRTSGAYGLRIARDKTVRGGGAPAFSATAKAALAALLAQAPMTTPPAASEALAICARFAKSAGGDRHRG